MLQMITDALREVWQSFLDGLIVFLPRLIATLTILIVGLLVAWLLATLTRRLLGVLRFHPLIGRVRGGEMFRRAGIPPADLLVSSVVYWLALVGFILSGLQALGITGMETVVSDFLLYLPR